MSGFIVVLLVALVFIIVFQIGKASEYATLLQGEENAKYRSNRVLAWLLVAFFLLGLYGMWICNEYFSDKLLPHSASENGVEYDNMFRVTAIVTGIVFFATQALLFWFAFRYQATASRKSHFFAHSNKLEILWTTIPAIAMAILVAVGLKNWAKFTSVAPQEAMVVEIVGKQFNWIVRYPGADGELGKRDFRKINDANNILGMDWTDPHNSDDIVAQNGEVHVVVNKPIKLLIGSRDVIHDVGLPHFRMKMDAVPGIATTMWFTPTITTDSMKRITGNPNFVYEISCDQMCGKGHYSMRGTIVVQTQDEYNEWLKTQKSYYASNVAAPAEAVPATDSTKAIKADTTKAVTMK
ncbi:MAG: cytochrome c oxidase subunit II [Chitinophagia bacterium]|nr:cytochrome c oxidase subunit II [Chitinophagia bacterium]